MHESSAQARSSRHCSRVQTERTALLAALDALDWRMLAWLVRYPFQRADDLVVGLARWTSRATVYRHLHRLEQAGLVTGVLPKTPVEGKRLYHLSNLGLHLLATHLGTSARILARDWQSDEAGLLRLVPRLPILLPVQDIVNGLVIHAADALTVQGRPTLVRWNWQRDLVHRFRFREQAMRLFVDGVVALYVRTHAENCSWEDRWYGIFLLSTNLEDERVMQQRLERLLCWRECAERWSQYQHMLPVLLLAHSPRQRDHWQRAMAQATQQVRADPLVGAITVMPDGAYQSCNPWQLNWHTVSTGCGCHLSDVLHPIPLTALPPALRPDDDMEGLSNHWLSPSHRTPSVSSAPLPARLSRIIGGKLPEHVGAGMPHAGNEAERLAWLAWQVTPGQWQILHLLLAHPLLSAEDLAILLHLQRHAVRCALYALHHLQCVVPVATTVGQRWYLDEWGLRLLTATNRVPLRTLATVAEATAATATPDSPTVVQHGVPWLLKQSEHTAGVYSFFVQLVLATHHRSSQALCWWETGAQCACRYQVNDHWYNLRPDALAASAVGQRLVQFWLEWDRGTMNVRDLTIKFTAYAHYLTAREWAREQRLLPLLLCVTPDIAQEQRIVRVAQATLAQTPGLSLFTTPLTLLMEYGPLAAIWWSALPPQQRSEERRRQVVFPIGASPGAS